MSQIKEQPATPAADIQDLEKLYDASPFSSGDPVPLAVASFLLGMSESTIKKQVKDGSRRGFKTKTKKGKQWFLDPSEIPANEASQQNNDSISSVMILDSSSSVPTTEQPSDKVETDAQIELIRELQGKLEALTYRNGYLEAQLAENERQIKLLTDRGEEPNGWSRFWNWMLGIQK